MAEHAEWLPGATLEQIEAAWAPRCSVRVRLPEVPCQVCERVRIVRGGCGDPHRSTVPCEVPVPVNWGTVGAGFTPSGYYHMSYAHAAAWLTDHMVVDGDPPIMIWFPGQ